MPEPYQVPVARLWSDEGSVVGAGFLAPRGVVVTCAHVVNDALGRDQLHGDEPRGEIRIDLPWAAGKKTFRGSIVAWRPPIPPDVRRPDPCVDIAVLQLLGAEPPMEAALEPQSPAAVPEDVGFRVMGFPAGSDAGASARGTVRATDADGWHLVEADRNYGRTMEPGFSGAPAIADDRHRRLLGMIDVSNTDERSGVLIPVEALMRAWPPLAEPYRGLEAFREEDAAYFFGRDALKTRLWRSFDRHRVTLLTGPSGSGKSSLLNAGFLPQLRRHGGWRLARFRPSERPIQQLAEELAKAITPRADTLELVDRSIELRDKLTSDPERLSAYARALQGTAGTCLCLLIDQFEETFTLAQPSYPAEHIAFLAALTGLTKQSEPVAAKAVLALRSDYQTVLQSDFAAAELVEALNGDPTVLLRALTPPELEQVIRGPLGVDRLDVALDNGLLAQLLNDIARDADALPLLEFALTELWARIRINHADRSLSRAVYDKVGGISGALTRHADIALHELRISDAEAKRLFVELVRVGSSAERDARRPRRKVELDAMDPALWAVAQRLAARRLVVTTEGPAADIVHEALFRQWHRLAGWIEEERRFLYWRQRLEERHRDWEAGGERAGDLLSGGMLEDGRRWLEERADSLHPSEKDYLRASVGAEAAEQTRRASDALWDSIEFGWELREKVPPHELETLLKLALAPASVRLAFLTTAVTSESRARRLGRQPDIAARAALGLDPELARRCAAALVNLAQSGRQQSVVQSFALVCLGQRLASLNKTELPRALVEEAVTGIAVSADMDQLKAYSATISSFADHGEPQRLDEAVRTLIERTVVTIAASTNPDYLQIYVASVSSFANRVEPEAARVLIERVVHGISATTNPDQLQAYSAAASSFANRVEPAAARVLVERIIHEIAATTGPDQLQAYCAIVSSFANRVEPEAARALIERAMSRLAITINPDQLHAYSVVISGFASCIEPKAARAIIERLVVGISIATNRDRLEAYGSVIRSFANRVGPEAARSLVERAVAGIGFTTNREQLQAYAAAVTSLANIIEPKTARALFEWAVTGISATTNPDQLQAYSAVVSNFANWVNPEASRSLVEWALAGIATTSNTYQFQAYSAVVSSFADRVEPEAARALVERSMAGIAATIYWDQLQAYSEVIRSVADRVESETARALVERALTGIAATTNLEQLQAYGEVVRSFTDRVDSRWIDDAARALVERAVAGISVPTIDPYQCQAYGEVVRSFANRVEPEAARALVSRVVQGIASTTNPDRLRAYRTAVGSFADRVEPEAARALIERAVHEIAGTNNPDQLQAYGAAVCSFVSRVEPEAARALIERSVIAAFQCNDEHSLKKHIEVLVAVSSRLPLSAATFIATEVLKFPLAGSTEASEPLIRILSQSSGSQPSEIFDLWALVQELEEHAPWIPLRRACSTPEVILSEFRRLLTDGPTIVRRDELPDSSR